ncbi:MAG: 16S rRNA pseudouridine(516) synthase [Ruminococcus sp.]|nr:16S rRNA pseudouridine(516) synthase [Ruminococcus sp.]
MGEKMRLDRLVASQFSDISRADVKKLCLKKKITVNGRLMARSDTRVDTEDEIVINGKKLVYKKHIYIMMNKPAGVVCSTKEGDSQTVLDILPEEMKRPGLFPAGRLDKDTEGFVLITDDGELSHTMLSPKHHVPKTYFVRLEKPWEESYRDSFEQGMTIPPERAGEGEERCLPAIFEGSAENVFECLLTISEGKYHQVRRMFRALGNRVVYLRRISIGKLHLDEDLPLGGCLEIMHKDVENLLLQKKD